MSATSHAIVLLAVPVGALLVCLIGPRRKHGERRYGLATLIAGGAAALVLALSVHLCNAGDPWAQCLIIGASIWLLLSYAANGAIRTVLCVVFLAIMIGLATQYADLVHGREWSGHARPSIVELTNESRLSRVRTRLKEAQPDGIAYSSAWVRNLPCAQAMQDELGEKPFRIESQSAWHSWYTRLYRQKIVQQDFWFPGGHIPDDADSIVLKDSTAAEAR